MARIAPSATTKVPPTPRRKREGLATDTVLHSYSCQETFFARLREQKSNSKSNPALIPGEGPLLACYFFFLPRKKKKQNGKMPRGGRDSGDKEGNNPPPCLDQRRRHKPNHSRSHEAWMSNRRSRCNPSIASGHTAEKEVGILVSLYFFPVNIDSLSLSAFHFCFLFHFFFLPKESLPCARYTAHVQYRHKCLRLSPPERGDIQPDCHDRF